MTQSDGATASAAAAAGCGGGAGKRPGCCQSPTGPIQQRCWKRMGRQEEQRDDSTIRPLDEMVRLDGDGGDTDAGQGRDPAAESWTYPRESVADDASGNCWPTDRGACGCSRAEAMAPLRMFRDPPAE